ncbi:hypothetical protein H5410_022636 [Solanum commersonii]|uniref:Uncharacterized protein n=1 Tax=Solanum commersonii TaxID=4109 RepID=A0A9J5ZEL5_SOLCO|nr:hypothetical protein H5410_022636 [Solanum commersonii]
MIREEKYFNYRYPNGRPHISVGESGQYGIGESIPSNLIAKDKPSTYPKLKIKFPSIGLVGIHLVEPQYKLSFELGDNLIRASFCHDSGMRGCWLRCKWMLGGLTGGGKVLLLDLISMEAVIFRFTSLKFLEIQRKNVRTSRDWVDEIWFEVKGKKYLKSFISSSLTYVSKYSIKERGNCKNQIAQKLVTLILALPQTSNPTTTPSHHPSDHQASTTTSILKNTQNNPLKAGSEL